MTTLKLWFTDFDLNFKVDDNYIYHLLAKDYTIELNSENPDYLIYSCYGHHFLNYSCIRIYYTAENLIPDFNLCDYAIGFSNLEFEDRYLRFPYFATFENQFNDLLLIKNYDYSIIKEKPFFCNFIFANSNADPTRDTFFHLLSKYKMVSSPGRHLNNIKMDVGERFSRDWMYSKINFQSKCKFSIAFENTSAPGYTTEKILHAFNSNTIPIYWGNPEVSQDFNAASFINCHDYENFEDIISVIKSIDNDDTKYLEMLNTPSFINNIVPNHLENTKLLNFFETIFSKDKLKKRSQFGAQLKYELSLKAQMQLKDKFSKYSKILKFLK
ncbi:glycosyltransferase family 10 domain-containing protein [Gillisia sp. Hel_I_29]|uniref:glycosyltransferase family 10 domain-containing protein n=1 Tax=Gillisia sp. Hel_I_29 TaxID=1249975 RepID=UPI00068BDA1B|nr:glycosyltransferase family 10 [Gillisia sp. Hel_I_29]